MPCYSRRYRCRRTWTRRRNRVRKRTSRTVHYRRYSRRRWVIQTQFRKREHNNIILKQFQPQAIKRVNIKGPECFFHCNAEEIYFTFPMSETSTVPPHLPARGGWRCKVFTFNALYDAFKHCRNVWTGTNHYLPLVRYMGSKFTLYHSDTQEYVFKHHNHYPIVSTIETYNACQPAMLMMENSTNNIPSKNTKHKRKPYTIVKIRPPAQMQNQWYFTHHIANTPLLLMYSAACSFDNDYISTHSDRTNISIPLLRTGIFSHTNFQNKATNPYWCPKAPKEENVYLYATAPAPETDQSSQVKNLICLGNTTQYVGDFAYADHHKPITKWDEMTKKAHQMSRNPFYNDYLNKEGTYTIFQSTVSWATLVNRQEKGKLQKTEYAEIDELSDTIRYSPNRDTGENTICYFKPITKEENSCNPPDDTSIINHGFPLYILLCGYTDVIKRMQNYNSLDTNYCLLFSRPQTTPPSTNGVMLNTSFIHGKSPSENQLNILDYKRWYPSLQMQYETINNICASGPGTPKLGLQQTTEAKCQYTFYFNFGGKPPKMSHIDDPGDQHSYPIPNNLTGTSTIDSPTEPIQTFLHKFETKRDIITTNAANSIKKDYETKTSLFTDGTNSKQEEIYYPQQKTTTDKEKETLQSILQQLQQRRNLRRRINQELMWNHNT
uniref:Capsid protein n=1 Tax=Torque teno mini virus 10 TaxID=2065036 RepID=A0A451ENM8_9VIRU|nr:hypothetical protein ORF1 [Torque teno mini virus 10]